MNIFRIIGEDMAKRFSKNLNPRYNLFVSRMDGLVNKELVSDEWNIDEWCNYFLFFVHRCAIFIHGCVLYR